MKVLERREKEAIKDTYGGGREGLMGEHRKGPTKSSLNKKVM